MGINETIHIIEVKHRKNNNIHKHYEFTGGVIHFVSDYESKRGLYL